MLELEFCDELPHAIDVDVQMWKMLVKRHQHILCSSIGESGDEGCSSTIHDGSNAVEEALGLLLLIRMITTTIGPLDEQDIHWLRFCTLHEHAVP